MKKKGMKNWKRYAVTSIMIVLVCAAVFLNWQYGAEVPTVSESSSAADSGESQSGISSESGQSSAISGDTKVLGEPALVSGDEEGELTASEGDETAVYTGSDYFASARLTRQQARDNAIALLEQAAQEEGASQEVLDEASDGIQVLASYTMKEAQIETLVTAKGYQDCVAFMGDDSLSVVVEKADGELDSTDVTKITDIAVSESGYPASVIKVIAAN